MPEYPAWVYFPQSDPPPLWVKAFAKIIQDHQDEIDSREGATSSDKVLKYLADDLRTFGFSLEESKAVPLNAKLLQHQPRCFGHVRPFGAG